MSAASRRMVDGLREVLTSVFEFSNLLEQQRTGAITRQLAAWAAILAVPTAIAGIYGMNFEHMPELKTPLRLFRRARGDRGDLHGALHPVQAREMALNAGGYVVGKQKPCRARPSVTPVMAPESAIRYNAPRARHTVVRSERRT